MKFRSYVWLTTYPLQSWATSIYSLVSQLNCLTLIVTLLSHEHFLGCVWGRHSAQIPLALESHTPKRSVSPGLNHLTLLTVTTIFMELRPSWKVASCVVTQEFCQHIMEHESSLLCSQEPSTGSYRKPDQSNPILPKIHINIILQPTSTFFPSGLFPSRLPTKTLHAATVSSCVLHALPISFFLTWPF
jgi:hypothetical protein